MITIGSLFTGYGGLDLATEAVFGGRTVWTSDVDPGACKIIDHRFGDVPNLGDITAIDWTQVEPVDVLTGGFPCQDLSAAGKRAGLRPGTRSGLWQHMAYAIDQLRPRYVIAENVRGLLNAEAHSDVEPCPWCLGDGTGGHLRALGAVLGDLADLGYDASWCGLRAADIGAPHGRFRVFILATDTRGEARLERPGLREDESRAVRRGRPADGDGEGSLLPTPTARDWKDGRRVEGVAENALLGRAVWDLLPTPTATDSKASTCSYCGDPRTPDRCDNCDAGPLRLLPTPNAGLGEHARDNGQDPTRRRAQGRQVSTADALCHLFPTPRATDGTKGGPNQRGSSGDLMLPSAVHQLLPTPSVSDSFGGRNETSGRKPGSQHHTGTTLSDVAYVERFGDYAEAVTRWQPIIGRPAPDPTIDGRLSPLFVEWMMGLPAGWVTDVPGLKRAQQLKALGNGVVPQQAAEALRRMITWFDGDGRTSEVIA